MSWLSNFLKHHTVHDFMLSEEFGRTVIIADSLTQPLYSRVKSELLNSILTDLFKHNPFRDMLWKFSPEKRWVTVAVIAVAVSITVGPLEAISWKVGEKACHCKVCIEECPYVYKIHEWMYYVYWRQAVLYQKEQSALCPALHMWRVMLDSCKLLPDFDHECTVLQLEN